jgi:hypothetical protein
LGAVNSGNAKIKPPYNDFQKQIAFWFQDDFRLSARLTLNLGLRYEIEQAPFEQNNQFSRYLDMNSAIPELSGSVVKMPSTVTSAASVSYKYNGAWVFADNNTRRLYSTPHGNFLPRIGLAIKLNDISALRIGYGRWAVQILQANPEGWAYPLFGYEQSTDVIGPQAGIPATSISNPFPSTNPLLQPIGTGYGRYTNLGQSGSWFNQSLKTPMNDRFSVNYQRQLPFNLTSETTFFSNFGHNAVPNSMWGGHFDRPMNMVDPSIIYRIKAVSDTQVANPFYNLLSSTKMPGSLRTQQTVAVSQLLRPMPQYTDLTELFTPGFSSRYWALQQKFEKRMSQGFAFSFGYNYNQARNQDWFNDYDKFNNTLAWRDRTEPRNRITGGGTYELPFGHGRQYANQLNPIMEAILGGWTTSHLWMWNAGPLLSFDDQMNVAGANPKIDNPTRKQWFNTSLFLAADAYTSRTNPYTYAGLRGPGYWSLDSTVSKNFKITERVKFEFRLEMYNMPNSFMPSGVSTSLGGNFGASTGQANYGREIQYTGRIHF